MYQWSTKAWMRYCSCAGWSQSVYFAHVWRHFFAWHSPSVVSRWWKGDNVLRFYGPVNWLESCQAWSVYITTSVLGRLCPLSDLPVQSFAINWQLTYLNQWRGEKDRRKYFMIKLHERMLPELADVKPTTSWLPVGHSSDLATGSVQRTTLQSWAEFCL